MVCFFISGEKNYLLADVEIHTLCVYDDNHNLVHTWDTQLAVAKLFEALKKYGFLEILSDTKRYCGYAKVRSIKITRGETGQCRLEGMHRCRKVTH